MINFFKNFFLPFEAKPLNNNPYTIESDLDLGFYKFGNKNPKKIFYVIRRTPGAGLFSNLIYVLNHLKIADSNKFIPIVDMKNFITIYNEKKNVKKTKNAWEYYFVNNAKYNLLNVYKSEKVIITGNKFIKSFSHNISTNEFRALFKKYFKIKKEFLQTAKKFSEKNFKNEKILAIHYRGTSYKTSANHPFPATTKQANEYINFLIKKYKYTKIFLCTEDLNFFYFMKKKFKNKILFLDTYRSLKDDSFRIYPRTFHRYKLGKEILIEALIMTYCNGFLHSKTNVSEFIKFIDRKKKINFFTLDNGFNSSNEYVARWLWYYKLFMPYNLGGFK